MAFNANTLSKCIADSIVSKSMTSQPIYSNDPR